MMIDFKTIAVSISLLATSTLNHLGDFTVQNVSQPLQASISPAVELLRHYPELVHIARCESGNRQFDDNGRVLQGAKVSTDRGYFQINEHYWKEEALNKGMDIETLEGNIMFAIDLYKRFGTRPWFPSRPCWSKSLNES